MDQRQIVDELIAGATVVTANDRLARTLKQAVADHNIAKGLKVWETPKALTLPALLDQQLDNLCASGDPAARRCLESHEAEALWERIIESSARGTALLQVRALAELAHEARGIALRHQLGDYKVAPEALDQREFKRWHEVYAKRLEELHATDSAALPDLVESAWARGIITPPSRVIFSGFDEFTPQAQALADALKETGAQVMVPPSFVLPAPEAALPRGATRVVLDDAQAEIERAAAWAAAEVAAGTRRIGIVVPDLQEHRAAVIDALDTMLAPRGCLPTESVAPPLYNLSLGRPLGGWPLVSDALRALALTKHEVDWRDASTVLRSPFFAGNLDTRAALEIWIRDHLPERFALEALAGHEHDPFFKALIALRPNSHHKELPSVWATHASAVLKATGWPNAGGTLPDGRALDRAERQTLEAWDGALRSICRLDAVLGAVLWSKFLTRLTAICNDLDFQPLTPPAPIQVLGYLEAAVIEFEALWVMGMDDERWPPGARPNPLLPLRLQADAITPGSSAAERLVHAQRITARLLSAAPEVIVSSPRNEGEAEHRPSPLIASLIERPAKDFPEFRSLESLHTRVDTEIFTDTPVPLAAGEAARGGTSLIQHQAACPFRAFAEHRLGAKKLEQPRDATDAASRGALSHDVLKRVWDELKSKATLDAASTDDLVKSVKQHVDAAIAEAARKDPAQWPLRLKVLEGTRLTVRVLDWLSLERERASFTVTATEAPREMKVGALTLRGKVDRIDDVDGKPVYIDYKTGKVDWKRWLGSRPKEPQLPLYATTGEGGVAGVMFARVKVGDHGFAGLAASEGLAPGLETWPPSKAGGKAVDGALIDAPDWDALQAYWRTNLTKLAAEFSAGHAVVDPERDACKHCHLPMLCRIDELGGIDDEVEGDEVGND